MDVNGLLAKLIQSQGPIIKRLARPLYKIPEEEGKRCAVATYGWLQNTFQDNIDVSECGPYRLLFENYYKINGAGKDEDWRQTFFDLLQRRDDKMSFADVLQHLYDKKKSVEPVFSSKLLATIRPELSPYDQHVGDTLGIHMPTYQKNRLRQIRNCSRVYCVFQEMTSQIVQAKAFSCIRTLFDKTFGEHTHFTDVKKLDFFLWQYDREGATE
ncbi:MAG: hypothetical protein OXP69_24520 [Spirochaetaceae bacterium]|nr:hypothetical protein [Spirochaetaceae bacterium]